MIEHFEAAAAVVDPRNTSPATNESSNHYLSTLLSVWDELAATNPDPIAALRAEHATYDFRGHGMWGFDSATEPNILLLLGAVTEARGLGINPTPTPIR